MKYNLLRKTNFFVCFIVILGFTITSFISYQSGQKALEQNVERVSGLAALAVAVIALVLVTITGIMRNYNKVVVKLTMEQEQKHQLIFQKAAEQFYENIYEIDITRNRPASKNTEEYFERLGVPMGTPFDASLQMIAQKQIKEEYRQGYIDTFSPKNVLEIYKSGTENLRYDFPITVNGADYYWMRIMAHIFTWQEDGSVRMIVCRQNIDEEKCREQYLYEKMQRDSLTDLLNQVATKESICTRLMKTPTVRFAFYIMDIDDFKQVNDSFGHAAGDKVLIEFAHILKTQFREGDILGRIGGDEFVAFLPVKDQAMAEKKARALTRAFHCTVETGAGSCEITASIGIAIAPQAGTDVEVLYRNADIALYQTKKHGKNGYTLYTKKLEVF